MPGVKQFIDRDEEGREAYLSDIVQTEKVVDLTSLLKDNEITWNVPQGEWTIMRLGARNNGACYTSGSIARRRIWKRQGRFDSTYGHLGTFTDELLSLLGDHDTTLQGGLKYLHIDSWEVGAQNWTPKLREEFKKRRGYDPQPFYPAYAGLYSWR